MLLKTRLETAAKGPSPCNSILVRSFRAATAPRQVLTERFGLDPEEVLPLMWRKFASDMDDTGE